MRPPVVSAELVAALKRLCLGRIAETLPERLVLAEKQDMSFEDLLLLCLTDELAPRDGAAAENRAEGRARSEHAPGAFRQDVEGVIR